MNRVDLIGRLLRHQVKPLVENGQVKVDEHVIVIAEIEDGLVCCEKRGALKGGLPFSLVGRTVILIGVPTREERIQIVHQLANSALVAALQLTVDRHIGDPINASVTRQRVLEQVQTINSIEAAMAEPLVGDEDVEEKMHELAAKVQIAGLGIVEPLINGLGQVRRRFWPKPDDIWEKG